MPKTTKTSKTSKTSKAKAGKSPAPYEPLKVPALKRLARRGGIKRLSAETYDEARKVIKNYLTQVVRDSVNVTTYSKRKTVTSADVMYALTRNGSQLYA